ncbi:MAG TPA: hypothetical protein VK100_04705 [Pseudogracilibacillus sp.]|nr:hypothetical protein [Pseudogracilibacillus sp.]
MADTSKQQQTFDTESPYAAVSGWLALAAAYSLFILLSALIMIIFVNPAQLSGFDIIIYLLDIIFLPILLITAYFWWNRKRIFPYLMIVFFLMIGIKEVVYLIGDASPNYFNIAASIVWIIYFFRSERVKQTFTK